MKKNVVKTACAAMAAAMCMISAAGCGSSQLDGTQTAAVVDGEEIPAGVLSFAVRYQQGADGVLLFLYVFHVRRRRGRCSHLG